MALSDGCLLGLTVQGHGPLPSSWADSVTELAAGGARNLSPPPCLRLSQAVVLVVQTGKPRTELVVGLACWVPASCHPVSRREASGARDAPLPVTALFRNTC